jgi:hypothetical protein
MLVINSLEAQNKGDEDMKPAGPPIGWGINIGNIRFFNNAFQFGLAPNIAWKLGESTAVGFMMKLDYYYERFPEYRNQKFSAFDLGPTVFVRWKPLWTADNMTPFLQGLFLQAEYERASIARPYLDQNLDIFTVREGENYLYLGLGAASGYPFSSFFSIHYNVLDDAESERIPFSYRLGFTYNY